MNAEFTGTYRIVASDARIFSFLFPRGYTMRIENTDHDFYNIVSEGPEPIPPTVQGLRLSSDDHVLSGIAEIGGLSYFIKISLTKTTAEEHDQLFLYGLVLSAGQSPQPALLGVWAAVEADRAG